jgi:hypothetical protein
VNFFQKLAGKFSRSHVFFCFVAMEAPFDVYRIDKQRYCWALVEDVDLTGPLKRICFRFTKTKDNHIEWIEFGSPRICRYRSKVVRKVSKAKQSQTSAVESIDTELTVHGNGPRDSVSGGNIQSTRYESTIIPSEASSWERNSNIVKLPPTYNRSISNINVNGHEIKNGEIRLDDVRYGSGLAPSKEGSWNINSGIANLPSSCDAQIEQHRTSLPQGNTLSANNFDPNSNCVGVRTYIPHHGTDSMRYESDIVPRKGSSWISNPRITKPPSSYNTHIEQHHTPQSISHDTTFSTNDFDRCSNSIGIRTYNPHHSTNSIQPSLSIYRPPDFVTPADASTFVMDRSHLYQKFTDNNVTTSHEFSSASLTPTLATLRTDGGIPSGWSGLDMLAAVTFDAAATTSLEPTMTTFRHENAPDSNDVPAMHTWSWGSANSSHNGEQVQNHNHVPLWPQQQPQQPDTKQRWLPSLDARPHDGIPNPHDRDMGSNNGDRGVQSQR